MSGFFCRIANSTFMQGVSIISGIIGFFITILTLLQTHRVSTALRNYQANLNNKKHFSSAFVSLHTTVKGLTEEINSQLQPPNKSPVFELENIPGINDLKKDLIKFRIVLILAITGLPLCLSFGVTDKFKNLSV